MDPAVIFVAGAEDEFDREEEEEETGLAALEMDFRRLEMAVNRSINGRSSSSGGGGEDVDREAHR